MSMVPNEEEANEPEVEVLPPDREGFSSRGGRVFDAAGRVEMDQGPQVRVGAGEPQQQGEGCSPVIKTWLGRVFGATMLGVCLMLFFMVSGLTVSGAAEVLRASGWWGKIGIVVITAAWTPFLVPAGPIAVVPGYLWGATEGLILVLVGTCIGGLINMVLARRFLGPKVESWVARSEVLSALKHSIDRRGFRIAFALRMSPVTPFSILSYLAGLSTLSYASYAFASVVAGIPWTLVYAMAGSLLATSSEELSLGAADAAPGWLKWFGFALTIGIAVWVGRAARLDLLRMRQEAEVEAESSDGAGAQADDEDEDEADEPARLER